MSSAATLGQLNWKKLWITVVVVYVVNQIMGFVIHALWLGETYASLASIWRPEAEMTEKMWIMFVTAAVYCFFFVYLFARGCEGTGIGEGVRFGVIIGLFVGVFSAYDWYVILPIPYSLALKWFLTGMIASIVMGIVTALLYKPDSS
ncbi:MAG: hypothetical protein ACE5EG_04140 [Thermoanaerobaculia bacterium]